MELFTVQDQICAHTSILTSNLDQHFRFPFAVRTKFHISL